MSTTFLYLADAAADTYDHHLPEVSASHAQISHILSIVFGSIAAISVLMIVFAGLRFVTAQGNPQEIAKARGTIAYAIAGLLIAIGAEAIVALVLSKL